MKTLSQLIGEVFTCRSCEQKWGFSAPSPSLRYFKFPPVIGCWKNAQLLFVGINPRISNSNRALHHHIMEAKENFLDLARNLLRERAYIAKDGEESHYRLHDLLVKEVFGAQCLFEQVAAVTEIFLCATPNSQDLPYPESPCAERYFPEVVRLTSPRVIVAVGSRVVRYLETRAHEFRHTDQLFLRFDECSIPVVKIPHPADLSLSESERIEQVRLVARQVRTLIPSG